MAYMRGEFYIWSDGDNMHFNEFSLPMEVVDQFVAMRWAQMSVEEQAQASIEAINNFSGNFGCVELCEKYGRPTAMDQMEEAVRRFKEAKD